MEYPGTDDPVAFRAYRAETARNWRKSNPQSSRTSASRYRKANPELMRSSDRKWRLKHPDANKLKQRKYNNLPEPTRPEPLICDVCKKPETRRHKDTGKLFALALDHCHKTGKFRGWLCSKCNTTLGRHLDDALLFLKIADYLIREGVPQDDPPVVQSFASRNEEHPDRSPCLLVPPILCG